MTTETGGIIYKAFAPTIKMMICIGLGVVLTKRCNFQPMNAKGVSILSLNISLPLLIFGSMVSAFTSDNIKAFGPLIMVAIIYQFIGLLFALITRELFYVPKDFQHGILVMGMLSNWGNLPTAVVQTLAKGSPFDPDTDVELGVAYIAVFVLVMTVTLFPLGMHKMCAWDFREDNLLRPDPLPIKDRWVKRFQSLRSTSHRSKKKNDDEEQGEKRSESDETLHAPKSVPGIDPGPGSISKRPTSSEAVDDTEESGDIVSPNLGYRARFAGGADMSRKKSRASSFHSMMESTRPIPPTAPLEASGIAEPCQDPSFSSNTLAPVCSHHGGETYNYHHLATPAPSIHTPKKPLKQRIWKWLEPFMTPFMAAIVFGIVCSVVKPIKALLVPVDGWSVSRIPNAPNDEPPLSFIMDTATFLGGVSIPGGLVLLGASFGRLKLPKKWSDIPFAAITAMTVFKMVITPLIGIFFIEGLRDHTTLYPREDKMRIFVAILLSGTPSSVNQLVITQLYNPNGTADTLSTFLALQYIMMPILSTALAAIALYVVK
ncbi:uncharacterized protein I206_102085 [Kwoniella pini CBS 10737]|uniref:Membrane protein n=1 Tax=Kwoniella pini CBS 10737 TaxID=1296096 RepID=A0A1B9HUW2_9TREE|nr:uncharacterized protein I206_06822 [Kwoniella pini CBS 10737]OCF47048.1 membrane protein [Kwoniella pini CBS 10737]